MTARFSVQLAAFAKKAGAKADLVVRKVVMDLATSIIERSPVGDPDLWEHKAPKGYVGGRFRANWQYGNYGGAGIPTAQLADIDPSGRASLQRIEASVPARAAGLQHVLINTLPYAMRLETGWSKQAPGGMVGLAALEFQGLVDRAVKEGE